MSLRIAIVSSAHGFGHAARDSVLASTLADRGHEITQFTHAPAELLGRNYEIEAAVVDVGLSQPDSFAENIPETLRLLNDRFSDVEIDKLAQRLSAFDLMVSDIPPNAMEAARRAGVPRVAMGNFDWAWIYRSRSPFKQHESSAPEAERALQVWAERIEYWQHEANAVALHPGFCGLPSFRRVERGGLLARAAAPLRVVDRGVLVCFGGFGLAAIDALLPEIPGVTWILAPPMPPLNRADCLFVDNVAFPSLLAGADAIFTKPGYGIFGEAIVAGTPAVWLERHGFAESSYLEHEFSGPARQRVPWAGLDSIRAAVLSVLSEPRPEARLCDDRQRIADLVLSCATQP